MHVLGNIISKSCKNGLMYYVLITLLSLNYLDISLFKSMNVHQNNMFILYTFVGTCYLTYFQYDMSKHF